MNMMKVKGMQNAGHLCKHYERGVEKGHYGNENIDQSRLDEDRENLGPKRFITDTEGRQFPQKQTDYIKEKISEVMGDRKLRKDAVLMVSWVIDVPSSIPQERHHDFLQESYNFLIDRYGTKSGMGEDVCISCYIHKSETTDHMHFAFLPVIERNGEKSFCAKEVVGREDLKSFHNDLADWMQEREICSRKDILNGNTKRDSTGRAYSVRELKKMEYERQHEAKSRWDLSTTEHERTQSHGRWDE